MVSNDFTPKPVCEICGFPATNSFNKIREVTPVFSEGQLWRDYKRKSGPHYRCSEHRPRYEEIHLEAENRNCHICGDSPDVVCVWCSDGERMSAKEAIL